jgi:hypothetical protein
VHWHDANTTSVDALAAAIDDSVAGGGAEVVGVVGALGVEAFDDDGFAEDLAIEDFGAEAFGREGTSAEGLGF